MAGCANQEIRSSRLTPPGADTSERYRMYAQMHPASLRGQRHIKAIVNYYAAANLRFSADFIASKGCRQLENIATFQIFLADLYPVHSIFRSLLDTLKEKMF